MSMERVNNRGTACTDLDETAPGCGRFCGSVERLKEECGSSKESRVGGGVGL